MIYECETMNAALKILKREAKKGRAVHLEAWTGGGVRVTVDC